MNARARKHARSAPPPDRTVLKYLHGHCDFETWPLEGDGGRKIDGVLVIPALAESVGLFQTLEDLAAAPAPCRERTLVLVVINNRALPHGREEDLADNALCLARFRRGELPAGLRLSWIDASSPGRELPPKGGVGHARKIGLDHGLRLLHGEGELDGPLISLDGDSRVDENYLPALYRAFSRKRPWTAVVAYAHPTDGDAANRDAIVAYEIFLRHHELGLAHARSPWAFPTIGSTIACTARAYATVGGMRRRRAGEDFYFLQALAKTGPLRRVDDTIVRPASRPSHRVPFGTGRSVADLLSGSRSPHMLYDPRTYEILRCWLELATGRLEEDAETLLAGARAIHGELATFLRLQDFAAAWERIRRNARSDTQLLRQFHQWFDGFRCFKLVHHLRDAAFPVRDLMEGTVELLGTMEEDEGLPPIAALRADPMLRLELLRRIRGLCSRRAVLTGLT